MRKRKRLAIVSVLVAMIMLFTTACGADFDASGYIQGLLDVSYKGETAKYKEMTDATEEEAQEVYNDNIDAIVEAITEDSSLSDEMLTDFRATFVDLMKMADYTVGEAVKNDDDSFDVPVEVKTYYVFAGMEDALEEELSAYEAQLYETLENGGDLPSDEEIEEFIYTVMLNFIKTTMENPTYSETKTYTFHVYEGEDGVYEINEDELVEFDAMAFDLEEE